MKKIMSLVFKGLAALLPLALSLYLLYWLFTRTESLMRSLYLSLLPGDFYFPGLGIVLAVAVLFLLGLMVQTFVFSWLLDLGDRLLSRIPVVKSVYNGLRDFMQFITTSAEAGADKVVAISMPDGSKLIGFITSETVAKDLFDGDDAKRVAVYLPLSYQMAGYTLYVEKSRLEVLDIGVEEALRITLTGGVTSKK